MELELNSRLRAEAYRRWCALMADAGLTPGSAPEITALLWDGEALAAAASRQGNVLKYIAVAPAYQGQDLTARVLTALRQDAFARGITHLFLYTKPRNEALFTPLFFYPVIRTDEVLLMENVRGGVERYLSGLPVPCRRGTVGAAVMNCNPFTRGHRYLIEKAAGECDWLYVLVLSEEQEPFPAEDRLRLVREGTAELKNVTVVPSGPYLISSATFPDYFLKDRDSIQQTHCLLDVRIFTRYYAPHLGITRRYVGSEPLSALTAQYNEALKAHLPPCGIEVREIPRLESGGQPVSAGEVRTLLGTGQEEALRRLVPETTLAYLKEKHMI